MEQNNNKLIKDAFFNCYKTFMDFLRIPNLENRIYYILVLRKQIDKNLTSVNIIINGFHTNETEYNYSFKNKATLSNEEAKDLINDIRIDFKDNHYISYSTVNPNESIQRLQNTNFSLNIALLNEEEQEEAIKFNDQINRDAKRHKVLTMN